MNIQDAMTVVRGNDRSARETVIFQLENRYGLNREEVVAAAQHELQQHCTLSSGRVEDALACHSHSWEVNGELTVN